MSIVDVKNLSIEFQVDGRWVPAVNNVSFDVKKGEILALVGESGCGKSVTCMSLARLLPEPPARYVSGDILLQGKSVLNLKKRELREVRRHNIGYIFQDYALLPELTLYENVALVERPSVFNFILDFFGR